MILLAPAGWRGWWAMGGCGAGLFLSSDWNSSLEVWRGDQRHQGHTFHSGASMYYVRHFANFQCSGPPVPVIDVAGSFRFHSIPKFNPFLPTFFLSGWAIGHGIWGIFAKKYWCQKILLRLPLWQMIRNNWKQNWVRSRWRHIFTVPRRWRASVSIIGRFRWVVARC